MGKQIVKNIFGVPSLQLASQIDDSDKMEAFEAASYRLLSRVRGRSRGRRAGRRKLRVRELWLMASLWSRGIALAYRPMSFGGGREARAA